MFQVSFRVSFESVQGNSKNDLSNSKMIQDCFKAVSRLLLGYFKGFARMFAECFMGVWWMLEIAKVFQENFKGVEKEVSK